MVENINVKGTWKANPWAALGEVFLGRMVLSKALKNGFA